MNCLMVSRLDLVLPLKQVPATSEHPIKQSSLDGLQYYYHNHDAGPRTVTAVVMHHLGPHGDSQNRYTILTTRNDNLPVRRNATVTDLI